VNLLISAGEASGDLHGARLLAALRRERPDLRAFGMGGERLAEAGLERTVASESLAVVGFSEVVEKLPALRRSLGALAAEARKRRPDAAVLIDFPDFHGLLARRLARDRIPLVYYVPPQVWAWRPSRAGTIARRARRILTLFPFETEIYRRLGGDAVCVGHPVVEDVREGLAAPAALPAKARRRLLLLPGSRAGELGRHWEPMADAAAALSRRFDLELVAVRAPGLPEDLFPRAAERGIRVVTGGLHPLLESSDLAFVASGTATLEAALCGTPMVVVYKTSAFSHAVARALVSARLRWISLVNILAGRELVTELLQERLTAGNLEREGEALLGSPERAQAMKAQLARVAAELGPPGASARAAQEILAVLRRSSGLTTDVFPLAR
jgi:lipid-A-disaccharide synthase